MASAGVTTRAGFFVPKQARFSQRRNGQTRPWQRWHFNNAHDFTSSSARSFDSEFGQGQSISLGHALEPVHTNLSIKNGNVFIPNGNLCESRLIHILGIPEECHNRSRWLSPCSKGRYHRLSILSWVYPGRGITLCATPAGVEVFPVCSGGIAHFVRSTTGYDCRKPAACQH